jgi:hypothetical protein
MRRQPLLASILLPETPEGMSGLAWIPRSRTAVAGAEPHPRMEAPTPLPFSVLRQYLTLPWQCYSVSSIFCNFSISPGTYKPRAAAWIS